MNPSVSDQTPVSNTRDQSPQNPVVTTHSAIVTDPQKDQPLMAKVVAKNDKKRTNNTVVVTLFGLVFLIASVAVSVRFVQQQQLASVGAWDCGTYTFGVSKDGIVTVQNAATTVQSAQKVRVSINEEQKAIFEVPELAPGSAVTIGSVEVPDNRTFTWQAIGIPSCSSNGNY